MNPRIGIIMGSSSDWETMKHACDVLDELKIGYEKSGIGPPDTGFNVQLCRRSAR